MSRAGDGGREVFHLSESRGRAPPSAQPSAGEAALGAGAGGGGRWGRRPVHPSHSFPRLRFREAAPSLLLLGQLCTGARSRLPDDVREGKQALWRPGGPAQERPKERARGGPWGLCPWLPGAGHKAGVSCWVLGACVRAPPTQAPRPADPRPLAVHHRAPRQAGARSRGACRTPSSPSFLHTVHPPTRRRGFREVPTVTGLPRRPLHTSLDRLASR